jgi:transposase
MSRKNASYPGAFKIEVVKNKKELNLSLRETQRKFEIAAKRTVSEWERIYDEQGPEGLLEEQRGRKPNLEKTRPKGEETLEQEVLRLRAENDYLKKLNALVREKEKQARKKK